MPKRFSFSILFVLFLISCSFNAFAQSIEQQKRNITAFNKLYGYVQYFHPSDEAAAIDWWAFSVYGSSRMLEVKNDEALIAELNALFKPIAPAVKIFTGAQKLQFEVKSITPPNPTAFKTISWQHTGLKLRYYDHPVYQSIRINRVPEITKEELQQTAITLAKPINISGFKGKRFILSLEIKSAEPLTLKTQMDGSNGSFKIEGASRTNPKNSHYSFSGTFDTKKDAVLFTFYTDAQSQTSVNHLKLQVEHDGIFEDFPVSNAVAALNRLPETISTNVILATSNREGKEKLFQQEIRMGESIAKALVPGIHCIVPMAVYGTKDYTYPKADATIAATLKEQLSAVWPRDVDGAYDVTGADLKIRLGDLIMAWNALRHSFPYWKDASASAEQIWDRALTRAFQDSTSNDFFTTLELMCAPLNDGHMFVVDDNPPLVEKATLPILFEYAEDQIVVKRIQDAALNSKIRVGDVLQSVDGQAAMQLLKAFESHYSGSPQWKRKKCLLGFLNGVKESIALTTFIGDQGSYTLSLKRTAAVEGYVSGSDRNNRKDKEWITDDIFYINLNKTSTTKHLAELTKAKSIIIDMRGYLEEMTDAFAGHLVHQKQVGNGSMSVPEILYPDAEQMMYHFSKTTLNPAAPLIKAKVYILQDGTTQSASESFTAFYKQFKLATIIGEASSGTNGDINLITLPGNYRIYYSGMYVQNADGSRHHLKGVVPDVPVKPSILGIKALKDEPLEKAIQLAKAFLK